MKKWGGNLFFFGAGSIALHFLNLQFIILAWVDFWGPTIAWEIRIGMTVIGAALCLIGHIQEAKLTNAQSEEAA